MTSFVRVSRPRVSKRQHFANNSGEYDVDTAVMLSLVEYQLAGKFRGQLKHQTNRETRKHPLKSLTVSTPLLQLQPERSEAV